MNCIRCNAPLSPDARFCRNCGAPVSINVPTLQSAQFQASPPAQPPYYQPTVPVTPGTIQSPGPAAQPPQTFASRQNIPASPVRRRRGKGLRITLITLVVFILILAGAWVFVLRPYLHSLAQNQLDSTLTSAVNQINSPSLPPLPPGITLPAVHITEDALNNSLVTLSDPSSPVQNMHIQITPNEMRLNFTVYGFASDISGRPTLLNGKLTVTNVTVGGVAGLVMSSDEMTALLNNHLSDVQARLHRSIASVFLINHELDIILR